MAPCPGRSNPKVVPALVGAHARVIPSPEQLHPRYGGGSGAQPPTAQGDDHRSGDDRPQAWGSELDQATGEVPRDVPTPPVGTDGLPAGQGPPHRFPETFPPRASSFHHGCNRRRKWTPALTGRLPLRPLLPGLARTAWPQGTPKRGLCPCPLSISPFKGAAGAAS